MAASLARIQRRRRRDYAGRPGKVEGPLGPSVPSGFQAFDLEVRVLTADERRQVRAVVELMKPAHTHFVSVVEPTTPVPDGGWVLGVDDLGTRVIG